MKLQKFCLLFCIFLLISQINSSSSCNSVKIANPSTSNSLKCDTKLKQYEKEEKKIKKRIEKRIEEYLKKVNQENEKAETPKKCKKIKDFSFVDVAEEEDFQNEISYKDLENEQEDLNNLNSMFWTGKDVTNPVKQDLVSLDKTEIKEEIGEVEEVVGGLEETKIESFNETEIEDPVDLVDSPVEVVEDSVVESDLSVVESFDQNSTRDLDFPSESPREIFTGKIILNVENVYVTQDLFNVTEFNVRRIEDKRDVFDKTIDEVRERQLNETEEKEKYLEDIEETVKRLNAIKHFFEDIEDPDVTNRYYKNGEEHSEVEDSKKLRDRKMAELFHKRPVEKEEIVEKIRKIDEVEVVEEQNETLPEMFMKQIQSFFMVSEEETTEEPETERNETVFEDNYMQISSNNSEEHDSTPQPKVERQQESDKDFIVEEVTPEDVFVEEPQQDEDISIGGYISFEIEEGVKPAENERKTQSENNDEDELPQLTLLEKYLLFKYYVAKLQSIVKALLMIGVASYVLSLISRWINYIDNH